MYPFEANMAELVKRYCRPDGDMLREAAWQINYSITGKDYFHRNDTDHEALVYMAAAMLLGKIKNPKLTEAYVAHDMLIYAKEANASRDHALIAFADKRYGLGVDLSESPFDMSLQGYLRCIPKGDRWSLSRHGLSSGIVKVSFIELNMLASNIIRKELVGNFHKASYNGYIDGSIMNVITDELDRHVPKHVTSKAVPPCMLHCQQTMSSGGHLPYNGRFALAAFYGKRGMAQDDIVKLFEGTPDYKESVTRMHVNNILEKDLMPYSCDKMEQYGLCKRHERCHSIKNPLSYR